LARAELEQARYEEGFGELRAPIAGIVGARRVGVGDLASASATEPLATISQSTTVRVRVSISDADYLRYVSPADDSQTTHGHDANWIMTLADGSQYDLPGRWVATSRAADPDTGTLELLLLFPNPDNRLRPGQFARVAADLEQRDDALLIPVTSVRISQGSKTVSILGSQGKVAQRAITADERTADSYIVTQGLAAGDRVIVGGEQKVRAGDRVTAKPFPGDTSGGGAP
jgi:membrane fusion protein (multidrug efflux system)